MGAPAWWASSAAVRTVPSVSANNRFRSGAERVLPPAAGSHPRLGIGVGREAREVTRCLGDGSARTEQFLEFHGDSGSFRIPCRARFCVTEHPESSAVRQSEKCDGAEDRLSTQVPVQTRLLVAGGALGVTLLAVALAVDLTGANATAVPSLPTPSGLPTALPSMPPLPSAPDVGGMPSDFPTNLPTDLPTDFPTGLPTNFPTDLPTALPGMSGGGS